jgi:hypothetical protein
MAVPTAPTALAIVPGDNRLTLSWTDPVATPAVTGHQIKVGGAAYKDCGASPQTVTGLQNGKSVTLSVRAVNADGNGAGASAAATPNDVDPTNDNGFDDATIFANIGAPVPNLDFNDPDD